MKSNFFLLIFVIIGCTEQKEVRNEFYKNGNLKSKIQFEKGLKNGKEIFFHENNKLKSESIYKNDTLEGVQRLYYSSGVLSTVMTYEKGVPNGEFFAYHPNGNISRHGFLKSGLFFGKYLEFFSQDSGKVSLEAYNLIVDNEEITYYKKVYDEEGNLIDHFKANDINIIAPDSLEIGKSEVITIEVGKSITYDSAIVIIGDFENVFNGGGGKSLTH